eukprot:Plantae.Rhodophyta-Hildenbrandia_rubra.ctg30123.p1 GENE.Plantae.Rhodophyta-Hildenbrandia_rubra.ctg30123~~Plantae.Rhodophyta-Hildenbrandia_rubra.ctg30123.p1  ORF type:complete len:188 (+),score=27.76 Plantae.Rhodophyta-Hildenbrandia_rubra.ctg30123:943-1506(+)
MLRRIRPHLANAPYAGYPALMSGDPLQLPVAQGSGILSDNVLTLDVSARNSQGHARSGAYYLELSESARQEGDQEHAEILSRIRIAEATDEDVKKLNSRIRANEELEEEAKAWRAAPALAALNKKVDACNNDGIIQIGSKLGAYIARSAPILSKCANEDAKKGCVSVTLREAREACREGQILSLCQN